jgi:hypothetical protein
MTGVRFRLITMFLSITIAVALVTLTKEIHVRHELARQLSVLLKDDLEICVRITAPFLLLTSASCRWQNNYPPQQPERESLA